MVRKMCESKRKKKEEENHVAVDFAYQKATLCRQIQTIKVGTQKYNTISVAKMTVKRGSRKGGGVNTKQLNTRNEIATQK